LLVEREAESARLDAVLGAAAAGIGSAVLIEGPPGIGKTTVLARARLLARERGMRVLSARGSALERDFAMGIVRQALEPAARAAGEWAFAGAGSLARGALLEVTESIEATPFGVLHGLYWFVANLAARAPVLLAVDDAHWSDEPSARFLGFLARRIESLPVALVITTRDRAPDAGVSEVLAELRTDPLVEVVALRPLQVTGVEQLLLSESGSAAPEFARACHQASGGNPFLVGELIRELRASGTAFTAANAARVHGVAPPAVARRVRLTLARLGRDARALAEAVAVLGDDVALDLAAELAGIRTPEAAELARELADVGVLGDVTPLRFLHPLVGAAVSADLGDAARADAHSRAAGLLRSRGASAERIALQLMHTAPAGDQNVVGELREAARRARGRGAPAVASSLLARALAEPPIPQVRAELELAIGLDEYAVGRTSSAAVHLEHAARSADDPGTRGRALVGLFQASAGDFTAQRALAESIEAELPQVLAHDRELGLRLWALQLLAVEPGPEWDQVARGTEQLTCDTPGEAVLLGHRSLPVTNPAATARAVAAVCERAAVHADVLVEEGSAALVMTGIVLGLMWSDQLESAERVLNGVIAVALRRGAVGDFALAHQFRAGVHLRAGRLREAEDDARTALAVAGGTGWAGAGIGALVPLVGSLREQGRIEEAEHELAGAGRDAGVPDSPALTPLLLQRMALRRDAHQYRAALDDWHEARRRTERHMKGLNASWTADLLTAAEIQHALGAIAERDALLTQAGELAEHWGAPGPLGEVRYRSARLLGGGAARAAFDEGVALLRGSPCRLKLAQALIAQGSALRRSGERTAGREPLREGYELARIAGAHLLAETARAELRATGIRLRREALSGADALTPSERRIAGLAAGAASNAEIAQSLFLTVKTVEAHLSNAYRKLGIDGRRSLAAALARKD
jgi:DNA-binding CsgD family transcriptional regulator